MSELQEEQVSPESQRSAFGVDKLNTAYQVKRSKSSLSKRLRRVYCIKMRDDKDDLKSTKLYKFDNTKESWNEFALKLRVNADNRGYEDTIDGTKTPLTNRKTLKYFQKKMRGSRRQKGKVGSQNGQQKGL